ncbi:hypothetical protein PRIPAC_86955 [Pristionchus pacificus]|uniref:Uncharacterized protein n=1 Tax=Pristionchus pacificus TaxID=54126 RepID=A0A2A6C9X0_PRIPA|nr:hypothetical protein PRIPAC_86955 [Pristionchus pacificus]|eukprot:PDM74880.1 hypothetical protein PRIPAC_43370 [Pristionchus pacificus]
MEDQMDEVRVYRVDDYEDDDFSSLDQGKRDVIREIEMEDMEAGRSIDTLIWIEEAYEVENRGASFIQSAEEIDEVMIFPIEEEIDWMEDSHSLSEDKRAVALEEEEWHPIRKSTFQPLLKENDLQRLQYISSLFCCHSLHSSNHSSVTNL